MITAAARARSEAISMDHTLLHVVPCFYIQGNPAYIDISLCTLTYSPRCIASATLLSFIGKHYYGSCQILA